MTEKQREIIEKSPYTEKYKDSLYFVMLPPMLKLVDKDLPNWVKEQGFSPKKDEQMSIFGDKEILRLFIEDYGLDPDKYPIHDAKMGTHIDIYDNKLIKKYKQNYPLTPTKEYYKQKINTSNF